MKEEKPIEIDGSVGEGGGQLVRVAVALSAVTARPIRIYNIRANRPGGTRNGGLKSQHFTAIKWLADATAADVSGLEIGSRFLEFRPQIPPTALIGRKFSIFAESSAASTLLILQTLLPFLLFAGGVQDMAHGSSESEQPEVVPLEIEISGGTNVSFSLSYEYLDQVLLPALQFRFGIVVERRLKRRGWNTGPQSRGEIWIKVQPLRPGQTLKPCQYEERMNKEVTELDVNLITPMCMHDELQTAISKDLDTLFPQALVDFVTVENSGHDSRVYILLVARTDRGLRWGKDVLTSVPRAKPKDKRRSTKSSGTFSADVSRKLCRELYEEVAGGEVDEHLQDQLVCFQALAEGASTVVCGQTPAPGQHTGMDEADITAALAFRLETMRLDGGLRRERAEEPFGHGSMHTRTARWVVSEIMPTAKFFHEEIICEGASKSFDMTGR